MIKNGQTLEILEGTFKGHKGIVKEVSHKITLVIELFGRKTDVTVSYSDLGLKFTPEHL